MRESASQAVVRSVLRACEALRVEAVCVCAGARNSAFVHALLQLPQGGFTLFPFYDERAAAFFALGRMKAGGRPVAVVTTSGTAVAEVLPAVIEAHYQALPLVVLSADRPRRFRGSGAPQAIEQAGLFGPYAETFDLESQEEAVSLETQWRSLSAPGLPRGPLHCNVCLEEPTPEDARNWREPWEPEEAGASTSRPLGNPRRPDAAQRALMVRFFERSTEPCLVMAGCLTPGAPVEEALHAMGAPILADATSGLHASRKLAPLLVRGGDRAVRDWGYRRVLRLGGVPSFRAWRDLERRKDVEVLSISERPFSGLARASALVVGPPGEGLREWGPRSLCGPADWKVSEAASAQRLEQRLREYPGSEAARIKACIEGIPPGAEVFVGNSLPIRELSLVAARQMPWRAHANRGANGIDGNLATFFGVASAPGVKEAWGLFGDLTTLYDLGAPGLAAGLEGDLRLRLVVVNNGGGRIFRRLPAFEGLASEQWKIVENPHAFRFADWAASWGFDHVTATEMPPSTELPQRVVIELCPDDEESEAFWQAWSQ